TLNGSVTNATGGTWSGGAGKISRGATTLTAVYTPTAGEITAGTVTLTLTTTGIAAGCVAAADQMTITITPAPVANANVNQTVCASSPNVTLNGSVTNATGGTWSGGAGIFNPGITTLAAVYTPTAGEITAGTVTLTLTTTGIAAGCVAAADQMTITITPAPTAAANTDQTVCASSPNVTLNGSVTNATGGTWSGGAGIFNPNATTLAAVYTPTAAEITAGTVTLTLTTAAIPTCCVAAADQMTITITPAPIATANVNQTVCASSPNVTLNGL